MSFGAIIVVREGGQTYTQLPPELECAITEIRVEQHLDEQTTFAIRFQEDFEGDRPELPNHPIFKQATDMAILAPINDRDGELVCLVKGQTENSQFDVTVGGPGSWFEVRGKDVRTRIDRICEPHRFEEMKTSKIAALITAELDDGIAEIAESVEAFTDDDSASSFNFHGTLLEAVNKIARNENFSFWLSYEVQKGKTLGGVFSCELRTTAHVGPSPRRNKDGEVDLAAGIAALEDKHVIRLLVDRKQCPNVASFSISTDGEAPAKVRAATHDVGSGADESLEAEDANDKTTPGGKRSFETPDANPSTGQTPNEIERVTCVVAPGSGSVVAVRSEAAATEAAWSIKGECLTSVHMFGSLLQPHELISVVGIDCDYHTVFQIADVTHVINPAEHWMQLSLRANSKGAGK